MSLIEPYFVAMPDLEYFAIKDCLGSSDVKALYKNPAGFWAEREAPLWYHDGKQSKAMEFGTNFHAALLTPDLFFPRLRVFDYHENHALKAAKDHIKDMREKHGEHCIYMKHEDHFYLEQMIKSCRSVPEIKRALDAPGQTEIAGFWNDTESGTPCKLKLDKDLPDLGWMLDVKTMNEVTPRSVQRQCVDYMFPIQGAHYLSGGNTIKGQGSYESFVFLCVEKVFPFTAALYVPDDEFIAYGKKACQLALQAYENSRVNRSANNVQSGIFDLSLPVWLDVKNEVTV